MRLLRRDESKAPQRGRAQALNLELLQVQRDLSDAAKPSSFDPGLVTWIEAIRLNFLGRTYYELQLLVIKNKQRLRENFEQATQALNASLKLFESLEKQIDQFDASVLWRGYVLRNLGLAQAAIEAAGVVPESGTADDYFAKALLFRKEARRELQHGDYGEISASMEVEIILVEMDMMRRKGEENTTTYGDNFNILVAKLKDKRPPYRLLGVWRQALLEASESAMILGKKNIADEFAAVLAREDP